MARLATTSATRKYWSISDGSSSSALLNLSKPSSRPSGGSESSGPSPGTKSTSSRSRTVLAYSARLRRRSNTRPPVLVARRCTARCSPATQRVTAASAALSGRASSLGGISPRFILLRTSAHTPAAGLLTKSGGKLSSRTSPFCFSAPWHLTQCCCRNGVTCRSNVARSASGWPGAAARATTDSSERSAAFRPQKRAKFSQFLNALVQLSLLRRERRAPRTSRASTAISASTLVFIALESGFRRTPTAAAGHPRPTASCPCARPRAP